MASAVDVTGPPRAVLSATVRILYRVLGEERLRTARGNAWEAVCADRRRASDRAEVARLLSRVPQVDHELKFRVGGVSRP